jgi:hypothetical protein
MSAQPLNREQWMEHCATLAQTYERAMNNAERNAEILRRARAGENSAALAAEYGLSRVYLDRIVHAPMPWEEIALEVRVYTCLRSLGVDPTDIDAITRLSPACHPSGAQPVMNGAANFIHQASGIQSSAPVKIT